MKNSNLAVIENPVSRAMKMAEPRNFGLEPVFSFLDDASREISNKGILGNFKIESKLKFSSSEQRALTEIKRGLGNICKLTRDLSGIIARSEFPILPFKPLKWRDKKGWPVLVPFRLDSPEFFIDFEVWEETKIIKKIGPEFPYPIRECFENITKTACKTLEVAHDYHWVTYFSGLIPISVVSLIKKVRSLFEEIYIIAEVANYKLSRYPSPKPKPANPDPLIVGYYGEALYLIAAFDLSPLEMAYTETTNSSGVLLLERSRDCVLIHEIAGLLEY